LELTKNALHRGSAPQALLAPAPDGDPARAGVAAGPQVEDCAYIVEGKFPPAQPGVNEAELSRLIGWLMTAHESLSHRFMGNSPANSPSSTLATENVYARRGAQRDWADRETLLAN